MRIFLVYLFLGAVFLVLESSVIAFILPKYLQPDLLLIIVFFVGFKFATWNGVLIAFCLGYLTDLFSGNVLGISSFALIADYLIVYFMVKRIYFNSLYPQLSGGIILEFIYLSLIFILSSLFQEGNVVLSFCRTVLPRAIITGIFTPFLIMFFERIESVMGEV